MQSFLQYRRFRKHVAAQYERDRVKAQALNGNETSTSASAFSSEATLHLAQNDVNTDSRDPEKAEFSKGGDEAHLQKNESTLESEPPAENAGRTPLDAVTTARTNQSIGTAIGTTLTGIEVRKRSTKEGGEGNVFVVGYEGEKDSMNPRNWSKTTRIAATYG